MYRNKINIIASLLCCIFISCGTNRYENMLTNADGKSWVSTDGSTGITFNKKDRTLSIINYENCDSLCLPLYNYKLEKSKITYYEKSTSGLISGEAVDSLSILDISKTRLTLFSAETKQVHEYTPDWFDCLEDDKQILYIYKEVLKQIVKFCNSKRSRLSSIYVNILNIVEDSIAKEDICNMELPISFIWYDSLPAFDHRKFFIVEGPYRFNRRYYCSIGYGEHMVDDMIPSILRSYYEFQWRIVFKRRHDGRLTVSKIIKHRF